MATRKPSLINKTRNVCSALTMALRRRQRLALATALLMISNGAAAQMGGLSKGTNFLTTLQNWLWSVGPIVAVIGGIAIGVMYMNGWLVHRDNIIKWVIGLLFVSVITEVVSMVF